MVYTSGIFHDESQSRAPPASRSAKTSWQENWQRNAEAVRQSYGERWYRLWNFFLAWSWRIGAQGNSECFQVVAHKNLDGFDRKIFLPRSPAAQRAA